MAVCGPRCMTKPAPLEGIKVVELARILAGPWAGQVLADLGATDLRLLTNGQSKIAGIAGFGLRIVAVADAGRCADQGAGRRYRDGAH